MRHSQLLALVTSVCSIVGCAPDARHGNSPASKTDATQSATVTASGIETAPGLADRELIGPLRDAFDRIDPAADGWQSEALSDAATSQLALLSQALEAAERRNAKVLSEFVAADFSAPPLRPSSLEREFQADGFTVLRSVPNQQVGADKSFAGPAGLGEAIDRWLAGIENAGAHPHVKLKLYRVEPRRGGLTSHVLCTLSCESGDTRTQINTTWVCDWTIASAEPLQLKLKSIGIEAYEEVVAANGAARFEDSTESILGRNACWQDQFQRGTDYWRARLPRDMGLDVAANHGLAVGDVNGDELDDLYICQQGGLPNRLFLQNADGTLRDASEESGTGWLDYCAAALFVDFDNDGDRDLAVSQDFRILRDVERRHRQVRHWRSDRARRPSRSRWRRPTTTTTGTRRFLHLRLQPVGGGNAQRSDGRTACPSTTPTTAAGTSSGATTATAISPMSPRATGLEQNNTRYSFAPRWEDYDNDGDHDLYVANDYGSNNLYRNDGGSFNDVAADLGVEDQSAGMSVSWADCQSRRLHGSLRQQHVLERRQPHHLPAAVQGRGPRRSAPQFQQIARGNRSFQAIRARRFQRRQRSRPASPSAAGPGARNSWTVNNDGLDDILVTNGFITTADSDDL